MTNQLLKYLPEIYRSEGAGQESSASFLGVFESLLDELDATIEDIPTFFDPENENMDPDFIPWY